MGVFRSTFSRNSNFPPSTPTCISCLSPSVLLSYLHSSLNHTLTLFFLHRKEFMNTHNSHITFSQPFIGSLVPARLFGPSSQLWIAYILRGFCYGPCVTRELFVNDLLPYVCILEWYTYDGVVVSTWSFEYDPLVRPRTTTTSVCRLRGRNPRYERTQYLGGMT